jgi:hypothetical protein
MASGLYRLTEPVRPREAVRLSSRSKPHLSRWAGRRGSEPALSEVEGMNLKEASRIQEGGVERFTC